MALILKDRIKETTTTTGTGTYNLGGAVTGFETFNSNLSNGDTTFYCCTDGTDFEVGTGTFTTSGTTLTRSVFSSSNSNNLVFWSSGTKTIFCTVPADRLPVQESDGSLELNGNLTLIENSNATANAEPKLELQRNSSSPADNDSLGEIVFKGKNDNDQQIDYAIITGQIADATDGTEDGRLLISLEVNATLTDAYAFDTDKFQLKNEQKIQWENHAGTSYEVDLVAGTPTANRTITLPDITGTVVVEGTSGTSLGNDLFIVKTDNSSNVGPVVNLFRLSDSPVDDDDLAVIRFYGNNSSAGALTNYGSLGFVAKDVTNGSEDGSFEIKAEINGNLTTVLSNSGTTILAGSDTVATREQLKGDATNGAGVFSDELIARKLHTGTIITKQDDTSQVMIAGAPNGGFFSQLSLIANRGYFMPVMIPGTGAGDTTNIASLGFRTGFSGTINDVTVHLGLYTLNKFGYPSQLVSKGSIASGSSANVNKFVTPDVTAIIPGRYALCLAPEGSVTIVTNFNSTAAGGSFYTEGFSDVLTSPRRTGLGRNDVVVSNALTTDLSGAGGFFDQSAAPFILALLADSYAGE
tara:strand:- start:6585 stop:8327 length:1743 start_codon:yes stop_codon:yes gene_type:complete